jgi:hypothetical protein
MFRLFGAPKHVLPSAHKFVKIPVFLKKCCIKPFFLLFGVIFLRDSTYYREYRGQEKEMGKKYASRNTITQKIALDCIYALALFVLLWSYFGVSSVHPTAGRKWAAQVVLLAKVNQVQLTTGNTYCLYIKLRRVE